MKLSKKVLNNMIRSLKMTLSEEIGCDECFDKLHEFAESELVDKSPEKAFPLVQAHLDRCGECHEENKALLEALKYLKMNN